METHGSKDSRVGDKYRRSFRVNEFCWTANYSKPPSRFRRKKNFPEDTANQYNGNYHTMPKGF